MRPLHCSLHSLSLSLSLFRRCTSINSAKVCWSSLSLAVQRHQFICANPLSPVKLNTILRCLFHFCFSLSFQSFVFFFLVFANDVHLFVACMLSPANTKIIAKCNKRSLSLKTTTTTTTIVSASRAQLALVVKCRLIEANLMGHYLNR